MVESEKAVERPVSQQVVAVFYISRQGMACAGLVGLVEARKL